MYPPAPLWPATRRGSSNLARRKPSIQPFSPQKIVVMEKIAPGAARRINPLQNPDWDALLLSRPDFSFFHGAAWARVLAETYGFTPCYFFSGNSEAPDALLPLMETDSWL